MLASLSGLGEVHVLDETPAARTPLSPTVDAALRRIRML
jgi:hypothetical protein